MSTEQVKTLTQEDRDRLARLADRIDEFGGGRPLYVDTAAAKCIRIALSAPPQPVAAEGLMEALDKAFAELWMIRLHAQIGDKAALTHARKAIYDAITILSTQESGK